MAHTVNWKADTEIDRIIDELEREHSGDAWHGNPLTQLLEGIDHIKAAAKPMANAHSIWEIVLHMTGWKNEVRRRLGGAPASLPADGDWPVPAEPDEQAWRSALKALETAHRALVASVQRLPEEALHRPTNDPRNRETGQGVSHYVLLHGIVQHDVYHSGQIALLRKVLDA
jgi:uncharacterized damage-inducible protein DinB